MNTGSQHQNRKPCRSYIQGHCRFGAKCKFSHDVGFQGITPRVGHEVLHPVPCADGADRFGQSSGSRAQSRPSISATAAAEASSEVRPKSKRGEIPCRAWKAGTCTKGSKCWFAHDLEIQKQGLKRAKDQKPDITAESSTPISFQAEVGPSSSAGITRFSERSRTRPGSRPEERTCRYWKSGACHRGDECQFVHDHETAILVEAERAKAREIEAAEARERAAALAREEAAKTINQLVLGSIVTYSAGLDIPSLITGFETCILHVKNLPFDVREDEVRALFTQQGIDVGRFHVVDIKNVSGEKLVARIVTDAEAGHALALGLDGIEFRDETLTIEVSTNNTLEGMNAAESRDSDVLLISWRSPSVRYVAEFIDIPAANTKVQELNRRIYAGRRVKVEMNTQPPGLFLPSFRLNAIKISNLPPSITDEEIAIFTGSSSVKRLSSRGLTLNVDQIAHMVRNDIERIAPGALKQFDQPKGTSNADGVVSVRAHFSSWDEAQVAHTHLANKRYGNQGIWLRLPEPMHYTIVLPTEQYTAQKAQWEALLGSIKDRKACMLNVHDMGNVVRIRLSGSVKDAVGAMKVRVENLARGETVEGWHRSLGQPNSAFVRQFFVESGAHLRADWKRQSLKVYGNAGAVERARELIRAELDRLASMDHTVVLARLSVSFFVRQGIPQLKETFGEDNIKFAMSSRKLTITGGEDARHALDRLITISLKGNQALPDASQGQQTCPICYDNVSSPHQLGCGHVYCVACLRHFLVSALDADQFPLTCLGDEARCRTPIPIPTIQQFLPPASFNRLLEAAFDSHVSKHPEEFKCCKTPDCTQIYRSARQGRSRMLQCPSCFSSICNSCNEDAHEGLSCEESRVRRDPAEQDRLNDAWIASQGGRVKKCPQCSVPIEKLEGCNHMTCRCGAHICWRCMGVFTENTIYPHMHSVHQTIHDDDPFVEPIDIEEQREALRQAEIRRVFADREFQWRPLDIPRFDFDEAEQAARRERERLQQERLQRERLQRETHLREERNRLLREQRQREEARARERRQQDGGWGCMIM
ncbi:hypothetical protein HYDPIDRAFT_33790 [Hydnomerulius pinastri MD-312]|uniref:RBR-type E3 ubiquitin transferase n=1 Tax=Hydnomerulius pinastri MD-312 TaxID=994086 RepID=A0A0C9VZB8_9AGAM|nr:hypothetical protein HYDPIDRAFT_33790 [Hydnomerulius pinastri MD-312]